MAINLSFPSMGESMMSTSSKARPVHEIRIGRIKAAIWGNETQNGTRHNVSLSRIYKDGDEWKDSTSFGRDDLPLVDSSLPCKLPQHAGARSCQGGFRRFPRPPIASLFMLDACTQSRSNAWRKNCPSVWLEQWIRSNLFSIRWAVESSLMNGPLR